ncbi:MAG: hypothetical protein N3G20_09265 [Verrucomicrobiae bacterium]|nr:hypothetical protein [Verrucomicrobiae bacterium]
MSKLDHQLDRLLRAAAAVWNPGEITLPFGFESRVVAELRAQAACEPDWMGVFRLLKGGLALSSLLALLVAAGTYVQLDRVSRDPWSMPHAVVWAASMQ